ncbi:hypothetical protein ASPCAL07289 [Aspergillus calidoustus]|uniref:F-box domain-containing protein n=1 Tax=Aspergillus calidoustus TaxID=454130 RepID=A0A0U5G3C4_ASPCI|nr:hypothetical protein ASPCAL07289 [Aspergillus calidoustus]
MASLYQISINPNRHVARCVLCGCNTALPYPTWVDIVRVIYSKKGVARISGLTSRYHPSALKEPADRRVHWGENAPLHGIDLALTIHESCWQYLQRHIGEDNVNLDRLWEIFASMPHPRELKHYDQCDPAHSLPNLRHWLKGADECPMPSANSANCRKLRKRSTDTSDCFANLPFELRESIAVLLPTRDYVSLRQASRAMLPIFHDNIFWKSRFWQDGERGFFEDSTLDLASASVVNWRLAYRMSSKHEVATEMGIKLWEISRWIQETLFTKTGSSPPPLDYAGRALQDYHNDSCLAGRRIERAEILPSLVKIGITFASSEGFYHIIGPVTDILSLEFVHDNGRSTILGTKYPKAKRRSPRTIKKELESYENENTSKPSPFDGHGVRVFFDAQLFSGFRFLYNRDGIYRMGVLQKYTEASLGLIGIQPLGCDYLDLCMNEVAQVVATFEGRRLVDLGLRGRRNMAA